MIGRPVRLVIDYHKEATIMADNSQQKPGLTTFGWLAIGATAAAYLSSSSRREKLKSAAGDLLGRFKPAGTTTKEPTA